MDTLKIKSSPRGVKSARKLLKKMRSLSDTSTPSRSDFSSECQTAASLSLPVEPAQNELIKSKKKQRKFAFSKRLKGFHLNLKENSLDLPTKDQTSEVSVPTTTTSPTSLNSYNECLVKDNSDEFLNASVQLLRVQGDLRQQIRLSWHMMQRLNWGGHVDAVALDEMRRQLLSMMKTLNIESQIHIPNSLKGYMWLIPTSLNDGITNPHKVWCDLVKDKGLFRMFQQKPPEVHEDEFKSLISGTRSNSCENSHKLPSPTTKGLSPSPSISNNFFGANLAKFKFNWSTNEVDHDTPMQVIALHGCRCKRVSSPNGLHQFEITIAEGTRYVFQTKDQDELNQWVADLQSICRENLLDMQNNLSNAKTREQYQEALQLPIHVPLEWLKRSIERSDKAALARRNSKNLPMIQISRDLERDRMTIDGELINGTEGIEKVIKSLAGKLFQLLQQHGEQLIINDILPSSQPPSSPGGKNGRTVDGKVLAFIERVLRGSSRTQSGGDIYDAITTLCNNINITICPISQDAQPVALSVLVDDKQLCIDTRVEMHFKMMPVDGDDALQEWSYVRGSLLRRFVLGKISEPGSVCIEWVKENLNEN